MYLSILKMRRDCHPDSNEHLIMLYPKQSPPPLAFIFFTNFGHVVVATAVIIISALTHERIELPSPQKRSIFSSSSSSPVWSSLGLVRLQTAAVSSSPPSLGRQRCRNSSRSEKSSERRADRREAVHRYMPRSRVGGAVQWWRQKAHRDAKPSSCNIFSLTAKRRRVYSPPITSPSINDVSQKTMSAQIRTEMMRCRHKPNLSQPRRL